MVSEKVHQGFVGINVNNDYTYVTIDEMDQCDEANTLIDKAGLLP